MKKPFLEIFFLISRGLNIFTKVSDVYLSYFNLFCAYLFRCLLLLFVDFFDKLLLAFKILSRLALAVQTVKLSVNDFFSNCAWTRRKLRICWHALKNPLNGVCVLYFNLIIRMKPSKNINPWCIFFMEMVVLMVWRICHLLRCCTSCDSYRMF